MFKLICVNMGGGRLTTTVIKEYKTPAWAKKALISHAKDCPPGIAYRVTQYGREIGYGTRFGVKWR